MCSLAPCWLKPQQSSWWKGNHPCGPANQEVARTKCKGAQAWLEVLFGEWSPQPRLDAPLLQWRGKRERQSRQLRVGDFQSHTACSSTEVAQLCLPVSPRVAEPRALPNGTRAPCGHQVPPMLDFWVSASPSHNSRSTKHTQLPA